MIQPLDTREVRNTHVYTAAPDADPAERAMRGLLFDRWLASVQAGAWAEGAKAQKAQARAYGMDVDAGHNPYEEY